MEINDKLFKNIAEIKSTDYETIISALAVVADFIKKRGYVLYGGMAIDIALKHRNHKGIYGEGILPDYDFMCADAYATSIELADLLAQKGFSEVTAINALHLTSRRVRINTVPIADITYIPQSIIDRIPTIKNNDGFTVVHPDFQRIDMLRSFNTMLAYPPTETIMHRTEKDIKRFRLLNEVYPVTTVSPSPAPKPIPTVGLAQLAQLIPGIGRNDVVLGGEYAYMFYYAVMAELLQPGNPLTKNSESKLVTDLRGEFAELPKLIGTPTGNSIPVLNYTYYTLDIAAVANAKALRRKQYYNRYMDDLGFRFIRDTEHCLEMHDCWGTGVPYHDILDFCTKYCPELVRSAKTKTHNLSFPLLAQPALLLQHFMLRSFAATTPEECNYYRNMYVFTQTLTTIGEKLYETLPQETRPKDYPYLFSLETFGSHTFASNEFRFSNAIYALKLAGKPPVLQRAPFTYEPKFTETGDKLVPAPEYTTDPDDPIYAIDGAITAPALFATNKTDSNSVF